jgi:hypothetical protein
MVERLKVATVLHYRRFYQPFLSIIPNFNSGIAGAFLSLEFQKIKISGINLFVGLRVSHQGSNIPKFTSSSASSNSVYFFIGKVIK